MMERLVSTNISPVPTRPVTRVQRSSSVLDLVPRGSRKEDFFVHLSAEEALALICPRRVCSQHVVAKLSAERKLMEGLGL